VRALTFVDSGQNGASNDIAYLAGGPFWCLEAVFRRVPGIFTVTSGFADGKTENPTFAQVCNGQTGHCEAIQVEFDLKQISYEKLLAIFWKAHDPTRLNSSFEVGTQYRSMILYRNKYQRLMAELSREKMRAGFNHPVATEIVPFKKFYKADIHHQGYYDKNINAPYCQLIIAPRLQALQNRGVIPKTRVDLPPSQLIAGSQT